MAKATPEKLNPDLTQEQIDDFWALIHIKEPDDCWIWRGRIGAVCYGIFVHDGYRYYAHNVAYTLSTGITVPRERPLMRRCRYAQCCNPAHIRK